MRKGLYDSARKKVLSIEGKRRMTVKMHDFGQLYKKSWIRG